MANDGSSASFATSPNANGPKKSCAKTRNSSGWPAKFSNGSFPKARLLLDAFDIAGATYPAEATGGDYFDYLPMLNERLGIVVGDVTGHGVGPALLMAETRAYLRILAG